MAYIKVDNRVIDNFRSDNIEAMLNSIIDSELSKDVSQIDTGLVNECIDALIALEQENDDRFNAFVPLLPADKFLNKIKPDRFSWKNANVFIRAGVAAAVIAGSTFTVNAAVEEFTGVNLIQTASQTVQNKLEQWGFIRTTGIDVIDGEDEDDITEEPITEESTTAPEVTQATTEETTANDEATTEQATQAVSTTKEATVTTTKKKPNIYNVDGDDDEGDDEVTQPPTAPSTTEATTNKPIEPTTEKPVVTPQPEEVVRFTGLSAEFDNFKTDYIYGESLSYDGLTLKANYSDGTYEIVELEACNYTRKLDMNVTADYTLRIIYQGSVLKIDITVRPDEYTRGSKICQNDLYDYLLTDKGAYITHYYGDEKNILLSQIDGNDVIAIGSEVFADKEMEFFNADNVERVFHSAFKGCEKLADCYMPRAVYIDDNAFCDCTSLADVAYSSLLNYLGRGVFKNTAVREIEIPSGITEIPEALCENCASLERVILNGRVTQIGNLAFSGCTALTSIKGVSDVKSVGAYAFADDTLVNCDKPFDNLEIVGTYAFSKCNSLDIGNLSSLKGFEIGSFEYCYLLKSVVIPNEMTKIPKGAFTGTRLASVALHDNITEIGDYAFMSTMLTEINLPQGVEKIGTRAFYTTRLRRVYFHNPELEIDDDAFFAGTRLTFYAPENSTAVKYAEENDIYYEII